MNHSEVIQTALHVIDQTTVNTIDYLNVIHSCVWVVCFMWVVCLCELCVVGMCGCVVVCCGCCVVVVCGVHWNLLFRLEFRVKNKTGWALQSIMRRFSKSGFFFEFSLHISKTNPNTISRRLFSLVIINFIEFRSFYEKWKLWTERRNFVSLTVKSSRLRSWTAIFSFMDLWNSAKSLCFGLFWFGLWSTIKRISNKIDRNREKERKRIKNWLDDIAFLLISG